MELGELNTAVLPSGSTAVSEYGPASNPCDRPVESATQYELIDTQLATRDFLQAILNLPTSPPSLYIDLEGANLSREGTISIFQVYAAPLEKTYLLDICALRHLAFSTPVSDSHGLDFKSILENPSIPKVIFDVRSDSDALYAHYHIRLQGIQDLQLMELAARPRNRRYIMGLAKCITRHLGLSPEEAIKFATNKDRGRQLFAPELGGSYEVFDKRPMAPEIINYCVEDVHYLPMLWKLYNSKLTNGWRDRVRLATEERVARTQSASYAGKGPSMTLAPRGWEAFEPAKSNNLSQSSATVNAESELLNHVNESPALNGVQQKLGQARFGSLFKPS